MLITLTETKTESIVKIKDYEAKYARRVGDFTYECLKNLWTSAYRRTWTQSWSAVSFRWLISLWSMDFFETYSSVAITALCYELILAFIIRFLYIHYWSQNILKELNEDPHLKTWTNDKKGTRLYVAVTPEGDTAVAITAYKVFEKIIGVFVDPDLQKFGVADKLMKKIFEDASRIQIDKIIVTSSESEEKAVQLYESKGFRVVERLNSTNLFVQLFHGIHTLKMELDLRKNWPDYEAKYANQVGEFNYLCIMSGWPIAYRQTWTYYKAPMIIRWILWFGAIDFFGTYTFAAISAFFYELLLACLLRYMCTDYLRQNILRDLKEDPHLKEWTSDKSRARFYIAVIPEGDRAVGSTAYKIFEKVWKSIILNDDQNQKISLLQWKNNCKYLELFRVNVTPEMQGLGIASKLMKKACEDAYKLQIDKIILETSSSLEKGASFYKSKGFQITDRFNTSNPFVQLFHGTQVVKMELDLRKKSD